MDHRAAPVLGPLLRHVVPAAIVWSRVYRGQHHPTDVVAGWLLGGWSAATIKRALLDPDRT